MAHLKRQKMPVFWPVGVKTEKFVTRPVPGPHRKDFCIPLKLILRDMLGYAHTSREAARILNEGKILIDKKLRKEPKHPVGFMDIIEIPEVGKNFIFDVNKKGLYLREIPPGETGKKICMVRNKKTLKKGIEQINLHDGRNIITGKKTSYKTGDSLVISLPDQKILDHLSLKKGAKAVITHGRNRGVKGVVKEVLERKFVTDSATVTLEAEGGQVETLKDYIFVLGEGKHEHKEHKKEEKHHEHKHEKKEHKPHKKEHKKEEKK
jgi:small subunit ribosomal protein S4e